MPVNHGRSVKKISQIYTKNFVNTHDCSINHEKSPVSMEFSGIIDYFMTIETKLNLRSSHYIRDGDPKTGSETVKMIVTMD